ncbi:hypothetical protein MMC15_006758, partial [Xylographa vitiligo]|nr:hypothetical protein [Xylographa vitiligo]
RRAGRVRAGLRRRRGPAGGDGARGLGVRASGRDRRGADDRAAGRGRAGGRSGGV